MSRTSEIFKKIARIRTLTMSYEKSNVFIEMPLFTLINVPNSTRVQTFTTFQSDEKIICYVIFEIDSSLNIHSHPNCTELIEVLEGEIIDDVNGRIVNRELKYFIESSQPHQIRSELGAIMRITFTKIQSES